MKDTERPEVEIIHHTYQPSKAELESDVSVDATPEQIARALVRDVEVREIKRKPDGGER